MALPSKPLTFEIKIFVLCVVWSMSALVLGIIAGSEMVGNNLTMTPAELNHRIRECEATIPRNQHCIGTVTIQVADNVESSR